MYTTSFIFVSLLYNVVVTAKELHPLSDDFMATVRKVKQNADRYSLTGPTGHVEKLVGPSLYQQDVKQDHFKNVPTVEYDQTYIDSLPKSFDARERWPNCPSLKEVVDQGKSDYHWAFATTTMEIMRDRYCIFSNGTVNLKFSIRDLLACAEFHYGIYDYWSYLVNVGVVSGGEYNSGEGCKPYTIPPCPHHLTDCFVRHGPRLPVCERSCAEGYNVSYYSDKRRLKKFYTVKMQGNVMAEVYNNGPVLTQFDVYEDFADYKSGIYRHVKGKILGKTYVKIIGWGEEDGFTYWLAAAPWGTSVLDKGFFKVLRDVNESGIEDIAMVAGEPRLDQ